MAPQTGTRLFIHRSVIHKSPKLETIQMSVNNRMNNCDIFIHCNTTQHILYVILYYIMHVISYDMYHKHILYNIIIQYMLYNLINII